MSDIITVEGLDLWYGSTQALHHVSMDIPEKSITALIGPSGCGKSTFLKTLDRMNDLVPGVRIEGTVRYDGKDIFAADVDVNELRRQVGMVFQKPNPFPMSIYDNVAYGPRTHGIRNRVKLDELVEDEACPEELRTRAYLKHEVIEGRLYYYYIFKYKKSRKKRQKFAAACDIGGGLFYTIETEWIWRKEELTLEALIDFLKIRVE